MKLSLKVLVAPWLLTIPTFMQAEAVTPTNLSVQNRLASWQHMNNSKSEVIQEYMDMKFGMFIHWGAYANLGGQWQGKEVKGVTEWIMLKGRIPRDVYKTEVVAKFNPTKFDAQEWVRIAKDAGMKYIVITAKHHDGFALYDSGVSDFDIIDASPYKQDIIAELYQAAKKAGIRLGLYYSLGKDWMDGGTSGCGDLVTQEWRQVAQYTTKSESYIEKQCKRINNYLDPKLISHQEYLWGKSLPQVKELMEKFPELLLVWFDGTGLISHQDSFNFYQAIYERQPQVIINSRINGHFGTSNWHDFKSMGDNTVPENITLTPWETAGTMNSSWGYRITDHHWKSSEELLYWLFDVVSKGGNYLLNVGPDSQGVIPMESTQHLAEIGHWLKENQEAIYQTRPWSIAKEGPTSLKIKGKIKSEFPEVSAEDLWFTQKDDAIYVLSLKAPSNGKLVIKSFNQNNIQKSITSVSLLGGSEPLTFSQTKSGVEVNLPITLSSSLGYALRVNFN